MSQITTVETSENKLNTDSKLSRFFTQSSQEWRISQGRLKLLLLLPFLIAFSGVVAALMGKDAYKMLTGEDKIAEYLQVAFWLMSFFFTLYVVKNYRVNSVIRVLYVLLAIGIFFLIGEEISWGQRIIGWATPESYAEINKQAETNIHNVHGVGYAFKWIHLLIGAYGSLLPLLMLRSKKMQAFRSELSMLIPHFTLIPFFFMPFAWRVYRNLFSVPKKFYFVVSEYSEVMELVLAAGFFFFLFYQVRQIGQKKQVMANQRA